MSNGPMSSPEPSVGRGSLLTSRSGASTSRMTAASAAGTTTPALTPATRAITAASALVGRASSGPLTLRQLSPPPTHEHVHARPAHPDCAGDLLSGHVGRVQQIHCPLHLLRRVGRLPPADEFTAAALGVESRSEEHTSELQSRFDLVCR